MPAQASGDKKKKDVFSDKIYGFLVNLEVERGSSPLTVRNYRHYLKRFSKWATKKAKIKSLSEITPKTIQEYRSYLANLPNSSKGESTLSKKTQAYHVIALRSFFKWLIKNDYKVMAPDKIDIPKVEERQVKHLSGEQIDRLLNAPTLSNITGKRDKAILEVFFSTGLRVSELTKLDRDKINFERREFGITGKGGKTRVVFLSSRATEWLQLYLNARQDHYSPMFIRHRGKMDPAAGDESMRLSPRSVQRMVKKYVRKVKLPVEATPHVLRHSFATDLLMAGADLRSVQEMLGHKNVSTTQVYTHVTNKHLKDVHRAFHGRGGKAPQSGEE